MQYIFLWKAIKTTAIQVAIGVEYKCKNSCDINEGKRFQICTKIFLNIKSKSNIKTKNSWIDAYMASITVTLHNKCIWLIYGLWWALPFPVIVKDEYDFEHNNYDCHCLNVIRDTPCSFPHRIICQSGDIIQPGLLGYPVGPVVQLICKNQNSELWLLWELSFQYFCILQKNNVIHTHQVSCKTTVTYEAITYSWTVIFTFGTKAAYPYPTHGPSAQINSI